MKKLAGERALHINQTTFLVFLYIWMKMLLLVFPKHIVLNISGNIDKHIMCAYCFTENYSVLGLLVVISGINFLSDF